MAKHAAKPLTDLHVKRAKPGVYRDAASKGLYLRVTDGEAKSWVFRFMLNGRARWMGLGPYPDVTLEEARGAAFEARKAKRQGTDPIESRRAQRLAMRLEEAKAITFQDAAEAYIEAHQASWKHVNHLKQWKQSLATYVYPVIGNLPVAAIDTGLVLRCIEPLWSTRTETMSRVRGRIESILDWARVRGYRDGENPAQWKGNLEHSLPKPSKVAKAGHYAALPYADMPAFMHKLRSTEGAAARALEFLVLVAGRSDEVRLAEPGEFDMSTGIWTVPAERMKGAKEHRVPVPPRALEIVQQSGAEALVFGRLHRRAMDDVLKRLAKGVTIHGMRSTFKDWCAEQTNAPDWVSEKALAHSVGDETRRAYQRGDLLEKRRQLMDSWARFCESMPVANVVPLRSTASA